MYMIILSSALLFAAVIVALKSIGGVWDDITKRYVADFSPMMEALSFDCTKLPMYLRWWGLTLLVTVLLIGIPLGMPPVALAAGYLVLIAPRLILRFLIQRRRIILRDQLVGGCIALSNSCRAGLTLSQGLEVVSQETPEPLALELKRIVNDYNHGRPLAASIREAKNRLNEDSFTLFASAILVSLDRGGRITDALERISASLQDSQRVERKLASDTAGGKTVVRLLSAFPVAYLFGTYFMYPEGTKFMFESIYGQFILAAIMLIVYAGIRWCQKIVSVQV